MLFGLLGAQRSEPDDSPARHQSHGSNKGILRANNPCHIWRDWSFYFWPRKFRVINMATPEKLQTQDLVVGGRYPQSHQQPLFALRQPAAVAILKSSRA